MYPTFFFLPLLQSESCLFMTRTSPEQYSYNTPCRHSNAMHMCVHVDKCKAKDPATLTKVLSRDFNGKLVIYPLRVWVPDF